MSLVVWLPLNGDLHNQGLKKYNLSMFRGTEVYNNNGKIGKCFYANGVNTIKILNIIPDFYNYTSYSLCAWIYVEAQNTSHTGSGIISAGNWNSQVLNLGLSDWSTDHYTRLRISGTNWSRTYQYNFSLNTWYHVVVSSDNNKTYAYVNGILIGNSEASFLPTSIEGNDMCIGGATYYSGMQFFGRINDVRIYNHCLSNKEVKEISRGLVLHYKLNQPNKNLLSEQIFMSAPWKQAIYAQENYYGKNSYRIGNNILYSQTGNGANNIFPDITYLANTQYTISVDWRDDYRTDGKSSSLYLRFKYTDNTYTQIISPANSIHDWTHSVLTSTAGKTVSSITTTYGNGGQLYIANLKLEKGAISTPYNKEENNIIYDSSGYNNNGVIIGTLQIENNSLKYTSSTYFDGNTAAIQTPNLATMILDKNYTISCWTYKTQIGTKNYQTIYGGPSGFELEARSSSTTDPLFRIHNWGGGTTTYEFNKWYHFCFVHTISDSKLYINGELKLTGTSAAIPSGDYFIGAWKTSSQQNYDGNLSDFRIYATALSADDILELYRTSKIVSGTTVSPRSLE